MKKVAIVGVEGSGKTVMLAGLGDLYSRADEDGYFLSPQSFSTHRYVTNIIKDMREGRWPAATSVDTLKSLDWSLKRQDGRNRPEHICEISFLDFAGEVYRAAFGIKEAPNEDVAEQVESLKEHLACADYVIVLINLRDIINNAQDERTEESMWITNKILETALAERDDADVPRAAIVLSQADNYAAILEKYGGAPSTLEEYLPHVYNEYSWLDIFSAKAVDKTEMDADGNIVPRRDFTTAGLKPIMDWVLENVKDDEDTDNEEENVEYEGDEDEGSRLFEKGEDYYYGRNGVSQDYAKAASCYRDAARYGNVDAQYALGFMYDNGCGVRQDDGKAVEWYRKSAEQGDATAQFSLGAKYANGQGVRQDDAEAVKWYRKSAEQGNEYGQCFLGCMYENGLGVRQDYAVAVKWYRKAAEQGYATAQNNLGEMYANGLGVRQDYAAAVKWYRKAAEQGNADAQNNLGVRYEMGQGVRQDYAAAVKCFRKSAEQGNAYGQCSLGEMYANGLGVRQDYAAAVKWYRKSAEQGNVDAQYNLGCMYANGHGVTKNEKKAVEWFRKAAEQGDEDAKAELEQRGL